MERVLDIGIGAGGEYIRRDAAEGVWRVGSDKNYFALLICRGQYDVPLVELDGQSLPFEDAAFNRVEILFPHDGLLFTLSRTDVIWNEFRRVLKATGEVKLVLDVPRSRVSADIVNGQEVKIIYPQDQIRSVAARGGFTVSTRKLGFDESIDYGTFFTELAAHSLYLDRASVFELTAKR